MSTTGTYSTKFNLPSSYHVIKVSGKGVYGTVVTCRKLKTGEEVAVKIGNNDLSSYLEREAMNCRTLMHYNLDKANIVKYHGELYHEGSLSLEFEALDVTIWDYLENGGQILLEGIRVVIQQLAVALEALKKIKMIHTDIKLENIMFVDCINQPFKVKLIDFGLAIPSTTAKAGDVHQPLHYRAPEIILRLPFSEAIDVWALGCVMAEMLMDSTLFPSCNEYQTLQFVIDLLGPPPQHLVNASQGPQMYFKKDGDFWLLKTSEEISPDEGFNDRRHYPFRNLEQLKEQRLEKDNPSEAVDRTECVELLKAMLQWNAENRITPEGILNHPFITRSDASSSVLPSKESSDEGVPPGAILVQPASPGNQVDTRGMGSTHPSVEEAADDPVGESVNTSREENPQGTKLSPGLVVEAFSTCDCPPEIIDPPETRCRREKKKRKNLLRSFGSWVRRKLSVCFPDA